MKKQFPFSWKVPVLFVFAMFLLAGAPAMAGDIDVTAAESVSIEQSILGLGVAAVPDYEGSDDYKAAPLLQARFNWSNNMYFSLLGNSARFNLIPSKTWHFGPMLRYRPARDDVDNDRVDAMKDVDAAMEVGAFLSYNLPNWVFLVSATRDVASYYGNVVNVGLGYRHMFDKRTTMTLFAETTYADNDYMDTYFSVDQQDAARSGLRPYSASAAWKDVGGGILVQHFFESSWGMMGVVKYTKLVDDASDSPLVDDEGDDNQWLAGVLVNYRF